MNKLVITLTFALAISTGMVSAQSTFQAILSGLNEVGPNASPGTGVGSVVLNAAQTQITVNESWSGVTSAVTASHIHTGAFGVNGGVTFGFTGVPATTTGAIPEQSFSITPAQVATLFAGGMYMNVHTTGIPGGEIRGQLSLVPEPAAASLLGLGLATLALRVRRK